MPDDPIKDFLQRMPYGFYAVTSRHEDDANAMVANWITQASFEPRLLAFALQKKAYSHGLIKDSGVFTLNLFLAADEELIKPFTKSRAKNPEKMSGVDYSTAPETGCPILEGAAAYLECRVVKFIDIGGDHDIVLSEPVGAGILKDGEVEETLTLVKVGWSYAG